MPPAELPPSVGSYEQARRAFEWALPERYNIAHDICDRHAGSGRVAAVHVGGASVEQLTFDALKRSSDELAAVLAARGVGHGSRVCTLLRNTPDGVIAALAVLKLGAAVAPLALDANVDTLREQVAVVAPDACIRDAAVGPEAQRLLDGALVTDGFAWRDGWAGGADAPPVPVAATSPDDPAIVCFTSGSTGAPKPVVLAHRFVLGTLPAFQLLCGPEPGGDDVCLAALGWAGLSGWRPITFAAWHFGLPVVVADRRPRDGRELCELLASQRVTCAQLMPAAIKLLRDVEDPRGLERLRVVYYAGEPLGPELQAVLERRFDIAIRPYYGSTEAAMVACGSGRLYPHRPGSVGRVAPGHEVAIVDEATGAPVAVGETGIIAVPEGDPSLLLGYLDRPDLTAEAFTDGRFLTGDVGRLEPDGSLWYVGRRGEIITTAAGEAVPATRIEDVALPLPGVADAVAVQVAVAGSRRLALYLLPAAGADRGELERAVAAALRSALPADLVPDRICLVDELPRTAGTGKVRRSALREAAMALG